MTEISRKTSPEWFDSYSANLREIVERKESTFADLLETVWTNGILGRVSPSTELASHIRTRSNKEVWVRSDPELYLRIMYSAFHMLSNPNKTAEVGFVPEAIARALIEVSSKDKVGQFFPGWKQADNPNGEIVNKVCEGVIDKCKQQFANLGYKHKPVKIGDRFEISGAKVRCTNFTPSGLIEFEGETPEDFEKLWKTPHFRTTISPSQIPQTL